jgi:two-component system OmpR family response regulator
MLTQVLKAAPETHPVRVQINKGITKSRQKTCGLILAECTLSKDQLERLKAAMVQPERDEDSLYIYETDNGLLSIVLPDQKLSATHFVCLSVKQFLQVEHLLGSSLLIASFSDSDLPKEMDVQMMIDMIKGEADYENTILIYNQKEAKKNKSTILIIDEDEAVGELLGSQLQMKGYQVYKANNGQEGLKLYDAFLPDLVITELSLPIYDGFEVIRSIRKKMYTDCSIMVLSDNQVEKEISACFEMGVSDYIKKPYSPVELEARIRRLLE